jgi:hypothetical protein
VACLKTARKAEAAGAIQRPQQLAARGYAGVWRSEGRRHCAMQRFSNREWESVTPRAEGSVVGCAVKRRSRSLLADCYVAGCTRVSLLD